MNTCAAPPQRSSLTETPTGPSKAMRDVGPVVAGTALESSRVLGSTRRDVLDIKG
ncbi:hypothetical protein [Actinoallomurus sp. CA-150999]|uniref:hypothetical protein n=1 Tax=Actinoallomurus sp. CA-150999 TaxID=3239887 RepID=UPI003D90AB60